MTGDVDPAGAVDFHGHGVAGVDAHDVVDAGPAKVHAVILGAGVGHDLPEQRELRSSVAAGAVHLDASLLQADLAAVEAGVGVAGAVHAADAYPVGTAVRPQRGQADDVVAGGVAGMVTVATAM